MSIYDPSPDKAKEQLDNISPCVMPKWAQVSMHLTNGMIQQLLSFSNTQDS